MAACRQLGFDVTVNSAIRSADPALEPNMKCIGSPVAEIWPFAYLGHLEPHLGGRGVVGGQRWHHSKERWRFPIGSPLWPLRYLSSFGRNLRSSVSDAQINRGWAKISGCSAWSRPLMFGLQTANIPGQLNGEIISEEFQPMWSQSTNITDGRTDGQTDRRHAIARPRFALSASRGKNVVYHSS